MLNKSLCRVENSSFSQSQTHPACLVILPDHATAERRPTTHTASPGVEEGSQSNTATKATLSQYSFDRRLDCQLAELMSTVAALKANSDGTSYDNQHTTWSGSERITV